MVLQGADGEVPAWSIPAGGRESGEDLAACCRRETLEETGYEVEVGPELCVKRSRDGAEPVEVHCFLVRVSGGRLRIQDPDGLIRAVAWKSRGEIERLRLSFPEDRDALVGWAARPEGM